jgi:lysine 2,3-aminomutase
METWQEVLKKNSISSLEVLAERFGPENFPELDRLRQAAENFEFRISPAMVDLIKSPEDPIWRQYVPSVEELDVRDGIVDSLNEDADSPVPNITHRYPDRALFLVSPVCATYCRFCTRRRKVGDPEKIPMSQFESAFQYLEQHTEIRDVIMSGGDPLLLNDRRLDPTSRSSGLGAVSHATCRSGSRLSCAPRSSSSTRSSSTPTSTTRTSSRPRRSRHSACWRTPASRSAVRRCCSRA